MFIYTLLSSYIDLMKTNVFKTYMNTVNELLDKCIYVASLIFFIQIFIFNIYYF